MPDIRIELEKLQRALDAEHFDLVHDLIAAIVALAGVALRILVGQFRAERGQHILGDIVLRGDQVDHLLLALLLGGDESSDLGVAHGGDCSI